MQISEVSVKVCRVVRPCQSVNARCSLLLDIKEGPPQDVDADVMQERCQFFPSRSWLQLLVCGPAPVSRLPDSASGPCFAVPHSSWSHRLPPPTPQWIAPLCSLASQVLSMSLTSSSRSSSATASGLPDAALGTVSPGRNEDLPVPAQEMYVHAQGLKTTQGGQGPRGDGPVPVAFCMPRRHRHPGLHCFRRSIPRLYAPLSTLRVLPHGSDPRMTRGQCGSLLLHCNGLSPSISCRSSRRTLAQGESLRFTENGKCSRQSVMPGLPPSPRLRRTSTENPAKLKRS